MVDPQYRVEQIFFILISITLVILHIALIIATHYDIYRALFYRHYIQRLGLIASILLVITSVDPYGVFGIYPVAFCWLLANATTTIVFASASGYFYLLCDTHYRNLQHPSPPIRTFKRFLMIVMAGMCIWAFLPIVTQLAANSEIGQSLFLIYTCTISFAYFVTLNIQSNRLVYALDCYLESILPSTNNVSNPTPVTLPSALRRPGSNSNTMTKMIRHVSFANQSSYDVARPPPPPSSLTSPSTSMNTISSSQSSSIDSDLMEHTLEITSIMTKMRIIQALASIILLTTACMNAVLSMENLVNGKTFQSDPHQYNGLRNFYVWEQVAALFVGVFIAWVPLRCRPLPDTHFYGRNRTVSHRPYDERIDGKSSHVKLSLNLRDRNGSTQPTTSRDSHILPTTSNNDWAIHPKDDRNTISLTDNPVYEEQPSVYSAVYVSSYASTSTYTPSITSPIAIAQSIYPSLPSHHPSSTPPYPQPRSPPKILRSAISPPPIPSHMSSIPPPLPGYPSNSEEYYPRSESPA